MDKKSAPPAKPRLRDRLRRFLFGFTLERRIVVLAGLPSRLTMAVRRRLTAPPSYPPVSVESAFDQAYGVETATNRPWWRLGDGSPTDAYAANYQPSSPLVLRQALERLPALDGFAFVDLGCGKGRAMIIASEFPFREIVGVEKSPWLLEIAAGNLRAVAAAHPDRPPMRLAAGDAAAFDFPPGDLVIYFFHPFWTPVMKAVAKRIAAALENESRRLFVVYLNPQVTAPLNDCPGLEPAPELGFVLSGHDELVRPLTVAVWRSAGQRGQPRSTQ